MRTLIPVPAKLQALLRRVFSIEKYTSKNKFQSRSRTKICFVEPPKKTPYAGELSFEFGTLASTEGGTHEICNRKHRKTSNGDLGCPGAVRQSGRKRDSDERSNSHHT